MCPRGRPRRRPTAGAMSRSQATGGRGMPAGHGAYRGLDLELLNPDDEDERGFLLKAQHPEMAGG